MNSLCVDTKTTVCVKAGTPIKEKIMRSMDLDRFRRLTFEGGDLPEWSTHQQNPDLTKLSKSHPAFGMQKGEVRISDEDVQRLTRMIDDAEAQDAAPDRTPDAKGKGS